MQPPSFEFKKAVQAVNYILRSVPKKHLGKLEVLKIVFLADRYHLRKYGRMITNDDYWAMQYGPVASCVKDITEVGDFLDPAEKTYVSKFLEPVYTHQVKSISDVDLDELSQTDREALSEACGLRTRVSDLVEFTHQFPEWQKHQQGLALNARQRMNVLDCFEDAPQSVEYCPVDRELLQLNRKHFEDSVALDAALHV